MAAQDVGCGCAALVLLGLLLLALVGLLLPLLPSLFGLLLLVGPVVLVAALVMSAVQEQSRRRLRRIAAGADRRFAGDICRLTEGYGQLTSIAVAPADPSLRGPRLSVRLSLLERAEPSDTLAGSPLVRRERQLELVVPPDQIAGLASSGTFGRFLRSHGISMVNDLAVEARATRAAFQCLQERDWAETSQRRLGEMVHSTRATLSKASGNELLEPAIPQLRQALVSFEAEQRKLGRHRQESDAMLRKLHDFLSVPEAIRPILTFDLEGLFDPSRLKDLRASFEEVVTLNDSYRALSRDRMV